MSKLLLMIATLLLVALLLALLLIASCGGAQLTTTLTTTTSTSLTTTTPTTTPITTTTTTATTPTTTTTTPTTTWDELAISGSQSFSINCAVCHGPEGAGGFGPAIIGPSLKSFETAQRLFSFISSWMPQSSPGSLPGSTYLQILAFMLIESEFVQPEDVFDSDNLANVILNE
ncbi:hypothetical protein KAR91_00740 [Candidatus Pacearchaeota archaeon]|nr:hypothetical protein [Candidatus Pacearchaeota archaeon]